MANRAEISQSIGAQQSIVARSETSRLGRAVRGVAAAALFTGVVASETACSSRDFLRDSAGVGAGMAGAGIAAGGIGLLIDALNKPDTSDCTPIMKTVGRMNDGTPIQRQTGVYCPTK